MLYPLSRHCDLLAVHVSDPFERDLPAGHFDVTDGNQRRSLHVSDKSRQEHQQHWRQAVADLQTRLMRLRAPLTFITTENDPLDQLRQGFGLGGGGRR